MKNAKMAPSQQNGRLPVGRRKLVQQPFFFLVDSCTKFRLPTIKWEEKRPFYVMPTSVWPRPLLKFSDSKIFDRAGHVCQIS